MDGYSRMVCKVKSTSAESSWLYGFLLSGGISFAFGFRTGFYYATQSVTAASLGTLGAGEYEIDHNQNAYKINTTSGTFSQQTFTCAGSAYYGAVNVNGTPSSVRFTGDLEDAQIYQSGNLVANLISCVNASGVAGFFDNVAKEFRGSVSEEAFLPGAVLIPGALTGLSHSATSAGIMLVWNPSENANEYEIKRDGVVVAKIYGDVTSYTDAGANGEYEYTVTPYNGTQAGAVASITVRTSIDAPANLNAIVDGRTVALTWDAVSGAEGYKVYRDGAVVASVASTAYTDTLTPPASVAYAVSAYAGTIQSEISQAVVVENWEGVLLTLITDRTAADVAEAKRLRDKLIAGETLTDEESARYLAGLRGAYNASDMNRVGAAVRYVADRLNAEGYGAYVDPKTDWQMEDIVRQSDWNKYLDEVRHLRRKLTLMRTTPQITDGMYSGLKSYAEANAIEQILVDLDIAITCIIRNYIFSGEVFAGEV